MREYFKKALRRLPLLAATLSAAALIVAMPSVSAAGVKKGFLSALRAPCRRSIRSACSPLFRALGAVRLSRKISRKARAGSFRPARERGRGGVHELCRGLPRRRGNDRRAISDGRISQSDAQRMTLFCVNAGPAFVIGGVGAGMLGSVRAGVIILCRSPSRASRSAC